VVEKVKNIGPIGTPLAAGTKHRFREFLPGSALCERKPPPGTRLGFPQVGFPNLGVMQKAFGIVFHGDLAGLQHIAAVGACRARLAFCSTSKMVVPSCLLMFDDIENLLDDQRARPSEGSSSSSILGRPIRARAMASICCSPPERVPPFCLWRSLRMGKQV
jgi:hypothetical protein